MTSFCELTSAVIEESIKSKFSKKIHKNHHSFAFVAKHIAHKHKCSKALKRKLKKYKLRHDGQEDQDVLDVSETLISSLTIKSPGKTDSEDSLSNENNLKPINYLFKMVRKRKTQMPIQNYNSEFKENPEEITNFNNGTVDSDISNSTSSKTLEKKHTNAFKLLMDSRNKSIGSNSPGKEKPDEESADLSDKKSTKAKRMLMLQKMAETKGSLKKKEVEEFHEKCIKRKLEERAQNFKSMLLNQESKLRTNKAYNQEADDTTDKLNEISSGRNDRALQLINIFEEPEIEANISKKNKNPLSKEDEEFLKKLSPSIKKKENMLCYFKKVEKESISPIESETENTVIKVKLATRSKKKSKKKKNDLKSIAKCDNINDSEINQETSIVNCLESSTDQHFVEKGRKIINKSKRKRNYVEFKKAKQDCEKSHIAACNEERPKRNVKKPIKYIDNVFPSSSDEELHIFTPKKKKPSEPILQSDSPKKHKAVDKLNSVQKMRSKVTQKERKLGLKKDVKLAPIFNPKHPFNSVENEAKQKFLQSGVPEQIKKMMSQQKSKDVFVDYFPVVVHVQQKNRAEVTHEKDLPKSVDPFDSSELDNLIPINGSFREIINNSYHFYKAKEAPIVNKSIKELLQHMKTLKPNFPVYRTYRLLRDKKKGELKDNSFLNLDNSIEVLNGLIEISNDNPDQLSWIDKYRATSTNQIIGNYETIKELKKWLISWNENQLQSKQRLDSDCDSSDFYNSDTDSRDTIKNGNNLVILTGPVGSGKTSSVYAVAAELAIKVIEVNASTKRNGKIILQDLREATKSHKVNRTANSFENSQKSQEIVILDVPKKRGRTKKTVEKNDKTEKHSDKKHSINFSQNSQEVMRTDSSLILIDDADIVFEQDDGFCSAIVQIVQSSKRPVILVTSSFSCPHLQRFLLSGKILKFNQLMPRLLGPWLDVMCLVENGSCYPGTGARFLDYFKGDIRKTINCLQFYTSPVKIVANDVPQIDFKSQHDDEKSSMSWADRDEMEEMNIESSITSENTTYLWHQFQHTHLVSDENILNIWWNLPQLLNINNDSNIIENTAKRHSNGDLQSLAATIDTISLADYFCPRNNHNTDVVSKLWYSKESPTVLEQENFDEYRNSDQSSIEISQALTSISLINAQKRFKVDSSYEIYFPGIITQRERDAVLSRHNNLTACLNPSVVLDRKSLALDYWPSCRSICSIEKTKSDSNSKRKNRFCHYLKSVNVQCRSECFDNLSDSLNINNKRNFSFK